MWATGSGRRATRRWTNGFAQTFETDKPYRDVPVARDGVRRRKAQPLRTMVDRYAKGTYRGRRIGAAAGASARSVRWTKRCLREQFGRLGGTVFQLEQLDVQLQGDVIVPMRELNRMRREAAEQLAGERPKPPVYMKRSVDVYADAAANERLAPAARASRTDRAMPEPGAGGSRGAQTDVALIYADFEFIKQFPAAMELCRAAGKPIALATPRIHMPGENGYYRNILKLQPDAVLVRNTGALYYLSCKRTRWRIRMRAHPQLDRRFLAERRQSQDGEPVSRSGLSIALRLPMI